jgi:hypothetical protein
MKSVIEKIAQERQIIGVIEEASTLHVRSSAQVEATLAVARSNLLIAQAIAEQNALAGGVLKEQFGVDVEDDGEEWAGPGEDGYC